MSGPLALIAFFICGFAFQGWAWAWIFFLVPGVFYAWSGQERGGSRRLQDGHRDASDALPPGHEGKENPPPQRYEG